MNLLSREQFNSDVFERDNHQCVICGHRENLAVHHIIDRKCFDNGGYFLNNGISLCEVCHLKAENGVYTCEELRNLAKITEIVLPSGFDHNLDYDKFGNIIKEKILKYPRTRHLEGSGISRDDSDEVVSFKDILNKYLVIEEKIDGANTGVSFNNDCELLLQCRGHYLKGKGDWPEFDQFKVWGNTWKDQLFDILTDRYVMYGEWMGTFHSVFYNKLPHYFMEFDIYDKREKVFLSTVKRREILDKSEVKINSVRVISQGFFQSKEDILACVALSAFVTEDSPIILDEILRRNHMTDEEINVLMALNKDRLMEGLYIKWEEDGAVNDRYKFVRPNFVQTILSYGKHWRERSSIPNKIEDGKGLFTI